MAVSKAETPLSSKPLNSIDSMDLDRQSSSDSSGSSSAHDSTIAGRSTAPSSPGNALRCDPSIVEIGADETLWNPDKTRYGGVLLPPKEYLEMKGSHEDIMKAFRDYLHKRNEPLTPKEQAQKERWLKAATGPCDRPFDQAVVDEAMEWC